MTDRAQTPPPEQPLRHPAFSPSPSASVEDSAAALDHVLVEMEGALRALGARTRGVASKATPGPMRRAGADLDRRLRHLGGDLHRVSEMTLPDPVRSAVEDAEMRVTLAMEEVERRMGSAVGAVTPDEVQEAYARETERLLRTAQSAVMGARSQLRPQIIRNIARLDRVLDYWQAGLFRVLWFILPPESLLRTWRFQALVVSRFFTDVALQLLLYGALISTARGGGGTLDAAGLGVAFLMPGVVLGLYGGAIADALPKRVALALAYVGMALACFAVAWGSAAGFWSLSFVLFVVRALHQVSQPSEASAVPLVADEAELASANSVISLASSAGEVTGKAVLAPLLVRYAGVRTVVTLAGVLFLVAATRVFDLVFDHETRRPSLADEHGERPGGPAEADAPPPVEASPVRAALLWLARSPDVLWMLLLAAVASTVGVVLGILGPEYTRTVLDVDPANALYVFLPAALGLVVALSVAPPLIHRLGERRVATLGFASASVAIAGLGLVDPLARLLDPIFVFQPAGVNERVLTASLCSIPLGVGTTLAAAATQTYVGRNVPAAIHGRAFAVLGLLKDGLAVVPLLAFGYAASIVGIRPVLVAAPLALFGLAAFVAWWSAYLARPRAAPQPGEAGAP